MSQTLIAVDSDTFAQLVHEVRALRRQLDGATITPRPEWVTVREAAEICGVSTATIRRKIAAGEVEAKGSGKTRRVRI